MRKILRLFIVLCIGLTLKIYANISEDSVKSEYFNGDYIEIQKIKHQLSMNPILYETEVNDFVPINSVNNDIDYLLLSGIGAGVLTTGVIIHYYQKDAWWTDQKKEFHIQNDWEYALWIDKVGHLYAAALISHGLAGGFEAANVPLRESIIYGSIGAALFQLYIEYEDGFGPSWGFSPGDAAADLLGAGYPVLQYYFPILNNFRIKASYYPRHLTEGSNPKTGQKHIISDDYEGQKFWLSVSPKNLLPKSISEYWPAALCLAVGMGVKDLDGVGGGQRDFYIALDIDAEQIPLYGRGWQFVKSTLNYFHLPLPGLRITNNTVFFAFCY